jgi:hypothetical protein
MTAAGSVEKHFYVLVSPRFPPAWEIERLFSLGQMLLWGETAQGDIRAVVIVGPHPTRNEVLKFFNSAPVILGYPSALKAEAMQRPLAS